MKHLLIFLFLATFFIFAFANQSDLETRKREITAKYLKYFQDGTKDPKVREELEKEAAELVKLQNELKASQVSKPRKLRKKRKHRKNITKLMWRKAFKVFWKWLTKNKRNNQRRRKVQIRDKSKSRELFFKTWGMMANRQN